MSTPQGPDRYGAERDPDHSGPPAWGTPPPGGWGGPDPGPPTGAWDPEDDEYDRGTGDRAYEDPGYGGGYDPGYGGGYDDRYDRDPTGRYDAGAGYDRGAPYGAGHRDEPWAGGGATAAWAADAQPGDQYVPGDEPWAPREQVRTPWRGPGGLGARALAGIGIGVVVVAAVLVLLFVTPGWAVTRTLDQTALQNGVTQILTQNYGLQVGAVNCPDDVEVSAGTDFTCQALVDGEAVTVPGKVTTDQGDYQVSRV